MTFGRIVVQNQWQVMETQPGDFSAAQPGTPFLPALFENAQGLNGLNGYMGSRGIGGPAYGQPLNPSFNQQGLLAVMVGLVTALVMILRDSLGGLTNQQHRGLENRYRDDWNNTSPTRRSHAPERSSRTTPRDDYDYEDDFEPDYEAESRAPRRDEHEPTRRSRRTSRWEESERAHRNDRRPQPRRQEAPVTGHRSVPNRTERHTEPPRPEPPVSTPHVAEVETVQPEAGGVVINGRDERDRPATVAASEEAGPNQDQEAWSAAGFDRQDMPQAIAGRGAPPASVVEPRPSGEPVEIPPEPGQLEAGSRIQNGAPVSRARREDEDGTVYEVESRTDSAGLPIAGARRIDPIPTPPAAEPVPVVAPESAASTEPIPAEPTPPPSGTAEAVAGFAGGTIEQPAAAAVDRTGSTATAEVTPEGTAQVRIDGNTEGDPEKILRNDRLMQAIGETLEERRNNSTPAERALNARDIRVIADRLNITDLTDADIQAFVDRGALAVRNDFGYRMLGTADGTLSEYYVTHGDYQELMRRRSGGQPAPEPPATGGGEGPPVTEPGQAASGFREGQPVAQATGADGQTAIAGVNRSGQAFGEVQGPERGYERVRRNGALMDAIGRELEGRQGNWTPQNRALNAQDIQRIARSLNIPASELSDADIQHFVDTAALARRGDYNFLGMDGSASEYYVTLGDYRQVRTEQP